MKAVYFDGNEAQYRDDVPMPERGIGESLLKINLSAVCTTDKEILKGYRPEFQGVMGHEFTAVVIESDGVDANGETLVGKRVVGEINEVCHGCLYCKTGREHHCINRRTPGLSRDGCFGEYMVLKNENLHVIPDELPDEIAIYTEPLAAAYEIMEQISFEPGTPTGVIGDGRLAYCVAQVLLQHGANVTVIGKHPEKLKLFKESVYAHDTSYSGAYDGCLPEMSIPSTEEMLNDNQCAVIKTELLDSVTMKVDGLEPYEIVVEATGSPFGLELALNIVRSMGTIVLKSTYAGDSGVNLSLIPVREITVIGSRCGPFDKALAGLASGAIKLPPIELYRLEEYESAFTSKAFKSGFRISE